MFHHGAFNPRFLGVTLRFRSPVLGRVFLSAIDEDDSGVEYDQLDDDDIGIVGVLDHEIKHYHDSLLSPFASNIFWLRLSYFLNGVQALETLKHLEGEAIFFSVKRWLKTPPDQRAAAKAAYGRPESFVDLPYFDPAAWDALGEHARRSEGPAGAFSAERFLKHAVIAVNAHDQLIEMMADGPEVSRHISTRNVFEMGAYAVQIEAVLANGNLRLAERFVASLMAKDGGPGHLLRAVSSIWHNCVSAHLASNAIDTQIGNTVATWALLGDIYRESAAAFPVRRLTALIDLWRHKRSTAGDPSMPPSALWDLWDQSLGVRPWRLALESLLAGTDRRLTRYDAMMDRLGLARPHFAFLLALYAQDQLEAVSMLLRNPDGYCNPGAYSHGPWALQCMPPAIIHKNIGFLEIRESPIDPLRLKYWGQQSALGIGVHRSLIIMRPDLPKHAMDAFVFFDERGRAIDLILAGERVEDQEFLEVKTLALCGLGKKMYRL